MFRTLVRHFARRLVQSSGEDAGEVDMSLGALLALLASPGVFIAIGLLDKYSSLLRYFKGKPVIADMYPRAVGDGYSLLVFSMAVTGLVTLWKWDRILPDGTDRLNLGPLPLPARQVFLASLAAIALVVGAFIVDVNAGSMLIFPMVVTADQHSVAAFLRLTTAHLAVLALGSLFAFCFCFSVMGALIALAPGAWFGGLSIVLRALLGFALLAMWITPARGLGVWREWMPPMWFAALYGPLIGRDDLGMNGLGMRGLWGLGIVFVVALGGYALGYRRGMAGQLVRSSRRRRWPRWFLEQGATPLERAAFRFSLLTQWRNEAHSLLVVAVLGAGLVVGVMQGDSARVPFFAGYSLILALRASFGMPATATANWPWRLLAVAAGDEPVRVGRRLLWLHFGALILVPTVILAPFAVSFVLSLIGTLLIEALLLDLNQIPFTVRAAGFRNTQLVHALLALVGLGIVPWAGGHTAAWITAMPVRALAPLAATAVLLHYRRHAAEALTHGQPPLVFEDREEDVIRLRL